jgi:alpha-methylacyl-CoA racemase
MTGWGQTGPLAETAGHDINYIALTGALHAMGRAGSTPTPPLNLVGDYGGGSMFLIMGILAALHERQSSGRGQVVDAAITEGTANLMSMFYTLNNIGAWSTDRGSNFLDSAAHFYDTYETSDGKYISLGPIESHFYKLMLEKLGLDAEQFSDQNNQEKWPELTLEIAAVVKTKTQDEWCESLEGSDVCFAPVLDFTEAPEHKQMQARQAYTEIDGVVQPAPAPRFSRTPSQAGRSLNKNQNLADIIMSWR